MRRGTVEKIAHRTDVKKKPRRNLAKRASSVGAKIEAVPTNPFAAPFVHAVGGDLQVEVDNMRILPRSTTSGLQWTRKHGARLRRGEHAFQTQSGRRVSFQILRTTVTATNPIATLLRQRLPFLSLLVLRNLRDCDL